VAIVTGIGFFLFWMPILHFVFRFSIAGIAFCAGSFTVGQLIVTPWLFSSRATGQNPRGQIGRRCLAVGVWLALWMELMLLHGLSDRPSASGRVFLLFCMAGPPVFMALIVFFAFKTYRWLIPIR
jgi:hypothetical protein